MERKDLNLWGIGDPKVEQSVLREAMKRDRWRILRSDVWIGAGFATLVAVGFILLIKILGVRLPWEGAIMGGLAGPVSAVVGRRQRRHLRRHLADVLREQGRCPDCGYQLTPETSQRCPECGREELAS